MSRWLTCAMCGRRKPVGIMSAQAWGTFELPSDVEAEHPALSGTALRTCPTCMERHPDWHEQLSVSLGIANPGGGALRAAQ